MYSMDAGTVPNITCTWPPSRSVSAGASPRYGTWTMLTRAIILNSSPDQMACRSVATRSHVHLARIDLGISNELGNCLRQFARCILRLWVPLAWLLRRFLRWNHRSRFWQLAGRDAASARELLGLDPSQEGLF